MGTSWYLDVNQFARTTKWAHGFVAGYAEKAPSPVGAGLLALAALLLLAWLVAPRRPGNLPSVLWVGAGALAALGLQRLVAPALAEPRPYHVLHNVELLVPSSGYPLPDARTAVAGAVVMGLFLAGRHWLGSVALLVALFLAFARVYVGADYPADVAAGLGFGAAVAIVLWPAWRWLAKPLVEGLAGARKASRPSRPLAVARATPARTPNSRAMDALRAASEAARSANSAAQGGIVLTGAGDNAGEDGRDRTAGESASVRAGFAVREGRPRSSGLGA